MVTDKDRILAKLKKVLADPIHGNAIPKDLRMGFKTLPAWTHPIILELFDIKRIDDTSTVANLGTVRNIASHKRKTRPKKTR
ncbi:MAG: hypothetical protein ABI294_04930 [Casimicrobiaceae bacterium]